MPSSTSNRAPVGTVRPSIAMGFGSTARNGISRKRKSTTNDPDKSLRFYQARMEADAAKIAAIKAAKAPVTARHTSFVELEQDEEAKAEQKNYGDQRVVIKFFYEQFGSPPEEEWMGKYGTVWRIRQRMADSAAKADTVYRTLSRLNEGDEDISSKPINGGGGVSVMSADEDLLVGLLACKGFSQTMALHFLNLQRYEQYEKPPVSLRTLRCAEARVQLIRRKRRSQKAGSIDLESDWAVASLAQSVQFQGQFKAGAELQGEAAPAPLPTAMPLDGPTLNVGGLRVKTCAATRTTAHER